MSGGARYLSMLGLDRKAAPIEDLDQYLARRAAEKATTDESGVSEGGTANA